MSERVTVIGAGMAGCEAAWVLANTGYSVTLCEMKPQKYSPAHHSSDFAELEALGVQQSAQALNGLWIVYALIPTIGLAVAGVFYLFYKLNDKDVQIMAKCNAGEITREEAESLLSRKY